jgi:5-methylcytosine-specific restriction endonuclease McrA
MRRQNQAPWVERYGRGWEKRRAATFRHYGRVCWVCGEPGADSIDHVVPISEGGTHTLDNLRPAHRACNSRRNALRLIERGVSPYARGWRRQTGGDTGRGGPVRAPTGALARDTDAGWGRSPSRDF